MLTLQIISITIAILLGVIVVARDVADRHRWLLLAFDSVVSLWIVSGIFADMPGPDALLWNRVVFVAGLLTGLAGYFLVASLANRLGGRATIIGGIAGLWCLTILVTPFVVADVAPRIVGDVVEGVNAVRGPGYLLYVLSLAGGGLGVVTYAFYRMAKSRGRFHSQLSIIAFGFVGMLVGGLATGVVLPLVLNSSAPANFAFLNAFIAIAAFTYAIVRQRLFDIRAALARTLGYFLAVAAIAIFYITAIFGLGDLIFNSSTDETALRTYYVGAALFVALTFSPLRKFFSRLTKRVFFRDSYVTADVLDRLNTFLVRTVDLKTLTLHSAIILKDAMKVASLDIVVAKMPGRYDDLLKSLATNSKWPVITDELTYVKGGLAQKLSEQKIALVSRMRTAQGLVGYIVCGSKLRGDVLTGQDIELLHIASDELAVAIQNALRFEEISRFNLTLKDEVDEATSQLRANNRKLHQLDEAKDEFISMASHQLRTPLTSVKGYLSMVLEGDAGKISDDQRKLLEEAYSSSQRMVYLIGDFLNVSRLQTGKFVLESAPVNLAHLVREEVEQLQATASRRDITLAFHEPAQFPDLMLDDGKMRQVVMNFIDNAIFYSKPNSTVSVVLTVGAHDVSFAVHDTGIGVPAAERHRLFTKFYRATNARKVRPDGTGIGLYMAKKVVTAHNGSIIFETKENKGSTFGFKLPVKQ